jgi:nucleoside-diphosphate-sugar epimerase
MYDPHELAPPPPPGTYFITGASGFIGTHLTRRLVAAGCHVVAADQRPPSEPAEGSVTRVACDITDRASVERALATRPIDYAVHLAARVGDWGDRREFERVNVDGTRNVLEGFTQAGVKRAMHISSIAVMGFEPGLDANEELPPLPDLDLYSGTKAAGELVAKEIQGRGAPLVIVRPGDVYGPGSEPWVLRPVRMMRSHQMFLIDGGTGHFGHVYVDNLIDGMLLALTKEVAVGRTYILTDTEQRTTFGEYFRRLAEATGAPVPRLALPRSAALLLARGFEVAADRFGFAPQITETAVNFVTKHCSYSIVRARRELGYAPRVNLAEGLRRIHEASAGPG